MERQNGQDCGGLLEQSGNIGVTLGREAVRAKRVTAVWNVSDVTFCNCVEKIVE
jgi:hypothetical protein